jgi:oligosaccharide repeat unit polymerase
MMFSIAIIIAIIVLIAYYKVWKTECKQAVVITPFVFVIYIVWFRIYPNFIIAKKLDITSNYYPFVLCTIAIVALLVSYTFGVYAIVKTPKNYLYIQNMQFRYSNIATYTTYNSSMYLLVLLLIMLSVYFYRGVPEVAKSIATQLNLGFSNEDALNIRNMRLEQTKGAYFGSKYRGQGLFKVILTLGWPVVSSYFLIAYINKKKIVSLITFTIIFLLGFAFIVSIGSRGPVVIYLMMILSSYTVIRPISLKAISLLVLVFFVLLLIVGAFSTKMNYLASDVSYENLQKASYSILDRLFIGNATNDIRVMNLVDSGIWDIRYGASSLRNIITSIPGVRYGMPVPYELYLQFASGQNTTFLSGTYLMTLYLDFKIPGVIIGYAVIGIFIGRFQAWYFCKKINNTILTAAFTGPISYTIASVLIVGISGLLANITVLLSLMMCIKILYVLSNIFSQRH